MVSVEEEFKNKRIIPLLRKMGFEEVRDNHGGDEFGKDILFSRYDEFGIKRYYAAQIKAGDINGRNTGDIDDIIGHTLRAFSIPFTDIITKKEIYIDEFYVIISGKFIGNAKKIILQDDKINQYNRWTHFIDGEYIENLFNQNFQQLKQIINSAIRELKHDLGISKEFLDLLTKRKPSLCILRKYNLEKLLSEVEFNDDELDNLYLFLDYIDNVNSRSIINRNPPFNFDFGVYKKLFQSLVILIPNIIELLENKLELYSYNK